MTTDNPSRLQLAFDAFHASNPQVYRLLVVFARAWRERHPGPCGIAMLFERVRWEVSMQTASGDPFKLSNNHRAYYARRIMADCPDLRGIFNLRNVEGE